MRRIDINADLGESFGRWTLGDDRLFSYISSANVACGMHAGDPVVMTKTVELCLEHKVACGAHPGYPDIQGFGRRKIEMSPAEIESFVLYQIGALQAVARARKVPLTHVKPHGALYNVASVDEKVARAVARGVALADENLVLVGLAGSVLLDAAKASGLRAASEGFCDRAYTATGDLVPRSVPGSVITDLDIVAMRAVDMVVNGSISAIDGTQIQLKVDTICIHSDTPGALAIAQKVRTALETAGVEISPLVSR